MFFVRLLHRTLCLLPLALLFAACHSADSADRDGKRSASLSGVAATAVSVTDDMGRTVTLPAPAARVISLIPSATETLLALGAANQIVGRTNYDVDPAVTHVPTVGGGLDPSVETIVSLRPDVVIVWESDKRATVPRKLEALGVRVFALRTQDTTDILRGIGALGTLTGRAAAAAQLQATLRADLAEVQASIAGRTRPRVMYVVFNDPPMTAGPGTFIDQLIGIAGGRSIFDDATSSWPTVAMEEIVRRDPDVVIVPIGEAMAAAGKNSVATMRERAGWRDVPAVQRGRVIAVNANLFNRPGPHVAEAARQLRDLLHPALSTRP